MQNTNETLFDIKAEAAVIASILAHPDYMMFCQDLLKPNYFYSKDNSCLYWACQEIVVNKGIENLDAFNLTTIIESNKAVSKTINKYNLPPMEEYIAMSKIIARNTIEEFTIVMNRVIELSFKRSLKSKAMSIVTACESDMSLDDLNNLTSNSIDSVVDEYVIGNDIKTIGERADELWQETQDRRTSNGLYGIPSKFEIINNYFTYEKGELVFLSARMKRGKSLFMMCCAIHKARLGIPTIYFDTEMIDRLFFERMLSHISGVEMKKIKTGKYSDEEKEKIDAAIEEIKHLPLIHIYDPDLTEAKIYSICKEKKQQMGLEFVVYDYFKSDEVESSAQYNELGRKMNYLKNKIAGDLELAVLAGGQRNRKNEVADSDKLERYCSVSLWWREKTSDQIIMDGEECGNYALTIQLNRLGESMSDNEYLDFKFMPSVMRIEQAVQHQSEDVPY